ncbi:hypothetical protein CLAFUW4_08699 [Fulvia fulva]|uniref:Uncharacterized protein n=1 Tax=Passalora fulva TaxID=5499 RepID=A0A9Q8PFZ8_PASFU|nr:uncharacterized protein CLAFUR5_08798 [Fulvia fulva]KAK4613962.1 hypothetical protein CLAFUR4_08704 [Fulvia fulva]UJO21914.1 hypothetical protein CLAFUR5_08798 [Fulvia fulva]WPV20094.1 hypothetical protein CLAFUW4_08699 [Fulvia fulva]WPV35359.1 hypothetical protein CLAFUW7_08699 [Fulvia fulva]
MEFDPFANGFDGLGDDPAFPGGQQRCLPTLIPGPMLLTQVQDGYRELPVVPCTEKTGELRHNTVPPLNPKKWGDKGTLSALKRIFFLQGEVTTDDVITIFGEQPTQVAKELLIREVKKFTTTLQDRCFLSSGSKWFLVFVKSIVSTETYCLWLRNLLRLRPKKLAHRPNESNADRLQKDQEAAHLLHHVTTLHKRLVRVYDEDITRISRGDDRTCLFRFGESTKNLDAAQFNILLIPKVARLRSEQDRIRNCYAGLDLPAVDDLNQITPYERPYGYLALEERRQFWIDRNIINTRTIGSMYRGCLDGFEIKQSPAEPTLYQFCVQRFAHIAESAVRSLVAPMIEQEALAAHEDPQIRAIKIDQGSQAT